MKRHEVRIETPGFPPRPLRDVLEFEVTNDMLEFADSFSMRLPFDVEVWDMVSLDAPVELYIDGSRVLTGFVDRRERQVGKFANEIRITGRDKGGRLVDDRAPLVSFKGLGILQLAEAMVDGIFPTVSLANTLNRQLIRGRAATKAPTAGEPIFDVFREAPKKVEPGETRAEVLRHALEEADLLAWSSADGKEFIVGKPNHAQAAQWRFAVAGPGGRSATNVLEAMYVEDNTDRYSEITACGSSKGSSFNYGPNVTRRRATVEGAGNFTIPKRLLIPDDDIRSAAQAKERAEREQRLRDSGGTLLELSVPGWSQAMRGVGIPAIYAFDTIATWEDEEAEISGAYLVTRVVFRETKDEGQVAFLSMVPKGTELSIS